MISGGGRVTLKGEARSNFAAQHLVAAEYFRSQLVGIETVFKPNKDTMAPLEYSHYWSATIVFAVMSLEANAYDLMTVADRNEKSLVVMRRFRKEDFRKPLIERYKLLHLMAKNGKKLPTDGGIGQDVIALVRLRDEIVHYKTEWRSTSIVSKQIQALLHKKFSLNPFKCGDIFFPEQCVSGDSAQWATTTARGFIEMFADITGFRLTI